jgi:hypothetical protein
MHPDVGRAVASEHARELRARSAASGRAREARRARRARRAGRAGHARQAWQGMLGRQPARQDYLPGGQRLPVPRPRPAADQQLPAGRR